MAHISFAHTETHQDCLASGLMVPQYFVVPTVSFVRQLGPNIGINVAEFEFPTYCNFFFYRRRVTLIVASKEIEERIRSVFQETLFGPNEINLAQDFPAGTLAKDMPDLRKELDYFRVFDGRLMQLEDLLEFIVFNEDGVATITGKQGEDEAIPPPEVTLQWRTKGEHDDGEYVIIQDDLNAGTVSDQVVLPLMEIPPSVSLHVFEPPLFGVTVLGNSHGFDPVGKTSGYVLWLSRRGYMIDPPPQSTALLLAQNIPPSLITGVIITHCHADHDAGTFQKILQEGRITLMTTRTIHGKSVERTRHTHTHTCGPELGRRCEQREHFERVARPAHTHTRLADACARQTPSSASMPPSPASTPPCSLSPSTSVP